jgi:LytS/YehU family sensor histidine kinase
MCQLLGEFLRESLLVGAAARISLAREVALIEQYLFIEKVRFGSRLDVSIAMAGDTADASGPPLLLQPLVENAVRHGVATRLEGGTITVVTRRAGDRVIVTIENPRDEDARRGGTGFGLGIVRRRLQAAFDRGEGALAIEAAPDTYRVSVTFPWEDIS